MQVPTWLLESQIPPSYHHGLCSMFTPPKKIANISQLIISSADNSLARKTDDQWQCSTKTTITTGQPNWFLSTRLQILRFQPRNSKERCLLEIPRGPSTTCKYQKTVDIRRLYIYRGWTVYTSEQKSSKSIHFVALEIWSPSYHLSWGTEFFTLEREGWDRGLWDNESGPFYLSFLDSIFEIVHVWRKNT